MNGGGPCLSWSVRSLLTSKAPRGAVPEGVEGGCRVKLTTLVWLVVAGVVAFELALTLMWGMP